MIDLQTSTDGMMELLYGDKAPSFIFALRSGALSKLQELSANGRMSRLIAPFTNKPLPDRETLTALLRLSHGVLFGSHLDALYAIDELWLSGKLDKFVDMPLSHDGQSAMREELVSLVYGMSHKTVSLAMLIYMPLACQLIPIDRHHLRRLGMNPHRIPVGKKYLALELSIIAERDEQGYKNVPSGTYAAHLWGIQRDGVDAESYPSHKNLSCRWY